MIKSSSSVFGIMFGCGNCFESKHSSRVSGVVKTCPVLSAAQDEMCYRAWVCTGTTKTTQQQWLALHVTSYSEVLLDLPQASCHCEVVLCGILLTWHTQQWHWPGLDSMAHTGPNINYYMNYFKTLCCMYLYIPGGSTYCTPGSCIVVSPVWLRQHDDLC